MKKQTKANGCRLLGSERSTGECQKFCYLMVARPSRSSRMWRSVILKYINVLCAMATTIDTWRRCISEHISRIKWMIFPLPSLLLLLLLFWVRLWRKVLKNTHFERILNSMACHEQYNAQQQAKRILLHTQSMYLQERRRRRRRRGRS